MIRDETVVVLGSITKAWYLKGVGWGLGVDQCGAHLSGDCLVLDQVDGSSLVGGAKDSVNGDQNTSKLAGDARARGGGEATRVGEDDYH